MVRIRQGYRFVQSRNTAPPVPQLICKNLGFVSVFAYATGMVSLDLFVDDWLFQGRVNAIRDEARAEAGLNSDGA